MLDVHGLLVDIDGVLVISWQEIPGAADALARCRSAGMVLRFLTNTTSVSRAEIASRLVRIGIPVEDHEIVSAPAATAAWLRANRPDGRCYLINSGDLADDFAGIDLVSGVEQADFVVLGGAGPEFSYTQMNRALALLLSGAELVGMHRNLYWRTADGFALDTGAYLLALERAANVEATVLGKPSADFFRTALTGLGLAGDDVAMIGDDIDNDILGAQTVGVHGVLVRTGKYRREALQAAPGIPDFIVDSIADVPELLGLTTP